MRAPTMALRARTGCDLQRIDDVADAIRDFGERYLDRVYTAAEQEAGRVGGAASLAARFAAKEAVLKLIGAADGVDPREVEITHRTAVPWYACPVRRPPWPRGAQLGPIDVSLSHSGDHALAVAVSHCEPEKKTHEPVSRPTPSARCSPSTPGWASTSPPCPTPTTSTAPG